MALFVVVVVVVVVAAVVVVVVAAAVVVVVVVVVVAAAAAVDFVFIQNVFFRIIFQLCQLASFEEIVGFTVSPYAGGKRLLKICLSGGKVGVRVKFAIEIILELGFANLSFSYYRSFVFQQGFLFIVRLLESFDMIALITGYHRLYVGGTPLTVQGETTSPLTSSRDSAAEQNGKNIRE